MSTKVRPYKRNGQVRGWEVDIQLAMPDGTILRERKKAPVSSKSGARRWGENLERELLLKGELARKRKEEKRREVPLLKGFVTRFLDGYARANRQKPSGIAAKETVLRVHLVPMLGNKKLNAITNEDVQKVKSELSAKAPKTVNNVLTVLNTMLKVATEWSVIDQVPCTIRLLKVPEHEAQFHDFDAYARLVEVAPRVDERALIIVLLGGDAGLRCGEIMAVEWADISLDTRQLKVQRSEWKGQVTVPKGGRPRIVPMTARLTEALRKHRHLRGSRVLYQDDGNTISQKVVQVLVRKASKRAGLAKGGVHILRHTFCSHLAMRGAPARAIQELAGHKDLKTTQRYMHLSPAAIEGAIRLLEQPAPVSSVAVSAGNLGDILETDQLSEAEVSENK